MNKKMFCLMFLLFTFISFSQGEYKCKFDVNETDKFTKALKIETSLEILHRDFNSTIAVSFCKHNNEYFIRLSLNLTNQVYSILKGNNLIFICGDSTITLISNESKVVSGFTSIVYNLTENQLNLLKIKSITDLRIYLIDTHIDKIIEPKKAEKIRLAGNCI
jgi:hypothetical protein